MKSASIKLAAVLWFSIAALAVAAITPEQAKLLPPPAVRPVDFALEIKPILEASCVKCHARGKAKGGLALDNRETLLKGGDSGASVVIGQSAQSYLIELVAGIDPDNVMPQKGSRLKPDQVGLLRAWIDQGLKWDAAVSFAKPEPRNLKPRKPELPLVAGKLDHPIDRLLQPYFAEQKFKPGPPVDDRLFARRVYLDVIGLLPPVDELEEFAADPRPDKRAQLVRRLLADDHSYAQHWLTFWNDLLRNDYRGTGYIDGGRKQITTWLYSALLTNMSYDRFAAQLINPSPESEGFTKGVVWRGVVNASQTPQMQAAQHVSQVFMGVNLKCSSCHDSFIDDWSLADAYGLAGIFADGPLEMVQCDKPTGKTAQLRFLYPELGAIDPAADRAERIKQLSAIVTAPGNGRLSRTMVNRLWAVFLGRGLVEPVDVMENDSWRPDLLDWLAEDFAANGYDLKKTMERILTSQAYQWPAVNTQEREQSPYVFRGPLVRRMTAEQFRDAIGLLTGVWYEKPGVPKELVLTNDTAVASGRVRASLVTADPLAVALGRPNREQVITTRASTATTLQALELTNGRTLSDLVKRGAEKLVVNEKVESGALAGQVYTQALGRKPTDSELRMARELVGQPVRREGIEDLLWSLTMLPEFQLVF